jgi:hypothetical protein
MEATQNPNCHSILLHHARQRNQRQLSKQVSRCETPITVAQRQAGVDTKPRELSGARPAQRRDIGFESRGAHIIVATSPQLAQLPVTVSRGATSDQVADGVQPTAGFRMIMLPLNCEFFICKGAYGRPGFFASAQALACSARLD